jgi:hypothetical protein
MKIFEVEFEPVYPIGCALIIAAETFEQARDMAYEQIEHRDKTPIVVKEVDISQPKVIVYLSGDY